MHPPLPHVSLFLLYSVFFRVGIMSFGGGMSSWVHREIVNARQWVTEDEFMSGFALGQILPGVNSTNLAIYIGQHLRGATGAVAALAGLLSGPFVVVLAAGTVYEKLITIPGFAAAMAGIAAVAVGMLARLGIVFSRRLERHPMPILFAAATVIAVGVLQWPLVPVVAVLAPLSIATAWRRSGGDA